MTEPAGNGSRRRLLVIGAALAVVVAIVVVVIAGRSDDSSDTAGTAGKGPTAIQGAATVTGITGAGAVPDSTAADGAPPTVSSASSGTNSAPAGDPNATSTTIPGTLVVQRTLLEPGGYNCTDTGVWQPLPGVDLTLLVGEPAPGSSCTGEVLDMPFGSCSTDPCVEVPADWRIDTLPSAAPNPQMPSTNVMMVVAPVSQTTAEFMCVVDLVPQPKQVLLATTTIEQACPPGATSNSYDLPPYVPPDTSDIPYVPPVSVDLPSG